MSSCIVLPLSAIFLLPLEKGIPTRWSGDSTNNFWEFMAVSGLLLAHRLGPLVVRIGVTFIGHDALDAALGELLFEFPPNKRIFPRILDLILGAVFNLLCVAMELHRRMERQIARHVAAGIKVLVKPF